MRKLSKFGKCEQKMVSLPSEVWLAIENLRDPVDLISSTRTSVVRRLIITSLLDRGVLSTGEDGEFLHVPR